MKTAMSKSMRRNVTIAMQCRSEQKEKRLAREERDAVVVQNRMPRHKSRRLKRRVRRKNRRSRARKTWRGFLTFWATPERAREKCLCFVESKRNREGKKKANAG